MSPSLVVENDSVGGIETSLGVRIESSSVIVTTGTFMRGLMHVGLQNEKGDEWATPPPL